MRLEIADLRATVAIRRLAELARLARADPAELFLEEVVQSSPALIAGFKVAHHLDKDSQLDAARVRLNLLRLRRELLGRARKKDHPVFLDRRQRRIDAFGRSHILRLGGMGGL